MDTVGRITQHTAAIDLSSLPAKVPSASPRGTGAGSLHTSSGHSLHLYLARLQFCFPIICVVYFCCLAGLSGATSAATLAHAFSAGHSDDPQVGQRQNPGDNRGPVVPREVFSSIRNGNKDAGEDSLRSFRETSSSVPGAGDPKQANETIEGYSVSSNEPINEASPAVQPVEQEMHPFIGDVKGGDELEIASKLASSTSWIFGMILGAAASFSGALGDNIVRLSFVKEQQRERRRNIFKRPLWLFGEVLTVLVNPLLSICALNFAPASLVVPFGGLHIAWNACLVQHFNGEEMSNNDLLSSFIIVCGLIFVVVFGSHELRPHTIDQLVNLAMRPAFTVYCICISILVALSLFGAHFTNSKELCTNTRKIENSYGRGSSIWKAARMLFSGTPLWAQRLSVTALSGTFGAGSNLFVKAVLEMLETEGLWHCLTRLPFYITGVVTVALCALQLFYLNLALSRYQVKYVVTLVNASLIAVGSAGGLLFFEEYKLLSALHVTTYAVGVMLVMGGVWHLASGDEFKGKPTKNLLDAEDEDVARDTSEDRLHLLAEAQGT